MLAMKQADWTSRYEEDDTKWDLGRSPRELPRFIGPLPPKQRVLVPGCGRGYEIRDFHEAGHEVTALDYSPGAIAAAREQIGELAGEIRCEDFFDCDLAAGSFDLCYERTFLCALAGELRAQYGPRIADLLKDDGCLVGVFHYGLPDDPEPPYPMTSDDREAILEPHFSLETD